MNDTSMDIILLVTRLLYAASLLGHAWRKVKDVGAFSERHGLPIFIGGAVTYAQFVAASMIALGLAFAWSTIVAAAITAMAALKLAFVNRVPFIGNGGANWDHALTHCLCGVLLLLSGPGKYAL